ncbi:hypothetical protein DBR42_05760 [Pelomonas sp. HMWF004]|nr:hypothetical protein DBR42_05760 [Pelomonas sp. HMWF004]
MTAPAPDTAASPEWPASFTCEQATMMYCDTRDRLLTAAESAQLQAHIAQCHPCSIASVQLATLFSQLDSLLAGSE